MPPTATQSETNAATLASDHFQCVTFTVAGQPYCIDIMSVREIRNWSGATELPNTQAHVRGVINLRGVIVPVIDMKVLFGLGPTEVTSTHVVVIVAIRDRLHGLLVDTVSDILTMKRNDIVPLPEGVGHVQNQVIQGLTTADNQMLAILSLEPLIPAGSEPAAFNFPSIERLN